MRRVTRCGFSEVAVDLRATENDAHPQELFRYVLGPLILMEPRPPGRGERRRGRRRPIFERRRPEVDGHLGVVFQP